MKCYTHPTLDAVGVCSQCGRGVCSECAKTTDPKLICINCYAVPQLRDPSKLRSYTLLSATLGGLGALNVLVIGIYSTLKLYHLGIMRGYQLEIYLISILTSLLMVILLYGSYTLWKTRFRRGGRLNLIAGIVTISIYYYLTWVNLLLSELGIVGLFLCIPPLVSGVLGILAERILYIPLK